MEHPQLELNNSLVSMRINPENAIQKELRSNGLLQLSGCLTKIGLEKRRNIRITCCECFSHLFLILILVSGYGLSKILHYDSYIYSKFLFAIPSTLQGNTGSSSSASTSGDSGILSTYHSLLDGPLLVPNFDQYIYASRFLSISFGKSAGTILTQTSIGRSLTNL